VKSAAGKSKNRKPANPDKLQRRRARSRKKASRNQKKMLFCLTKFARLLKFSCQRFFLVQHRTANHRCWQLHHLISQGIFSHARFIIMYVLRVNDSSNQENITYTTKQVCGKKETIGGRAGGAATAEANRTFNFFCF
jgi:hypothetical protein